MGTRAVALKRLGCRSGLKGCRVGKGPQMPTAFGNSRVHTHVSWSPGLQRYGFLSPSWLVQNNMHFQGYAVYMSSSSLQPIRLLCQGTGCEDHGISETHHNVACRDHELHGAGMALQIYLQKTLNIDCSDAAAVVEHAPSYVAHLVAVTKQETMGEEKVGEGDSDSMFSSQVQEYLSSKAIDAVEPVLESVGITREHNQKCLEMVDIQSLFSLIRTFEKLGVSRSIIQGMTKKDLLVLSYTKEEIEVGFHILKGLLIAEDELLSLIQTYPLIFKTEVVNNIDLLREELREFVSKDLIVKRAVFYSPQLVHTYRSGCAKEVVDFLKSYDLTAEKLERTLQKHACLVFADVEKKLKCNVQFLDDLGLSEDLIYKVVRRCPNFLLYSVENNLMEKLKFFKSMGFDETEFCQIIARFPNIFSVSVENKIKPAIAELCTLGLSENGLRKIVLYRPSLFGYRLGGEISALVQQLNQSKYPEDQKVTAFIKLVSRGAEHKKKCEDCLVEHGLSVAEAKEVLEKEPGVLGYNEDALSIKLEALTKTLGIPIHDVLTVPEYLSFGLRNRIQRRQRVLSYMKSKGLLTGALTLKQLVLDTNTQFYNDFVKVHCEDKRLSKIWFRERESVRVMGDPSSTSNFSKDSPEAEVSE